MPACATCGRGDLMQADVRNYQCLACGALTDIQNLSAVPSDIPNVVTAPSGHPVVELSETAPVVLAPAGPETPVEDVEEEEVPEAPGEVSEVIEEAKGDLPIDLSSLSDSQIQALRDALD